MIHHQSYVPFDRAEAERMRRRDEDRRFADEERERPLREQRNADIDRWNRDLR